MFGYVVDLSGIKAQLQHAADAQWRMWAGLAFTALAMVAIQYDELVAPKVSHLSGAWGAVTDFSRKLTSFTL